MSRRRLIILLVILLLALGARWWLRGRGGDEEAPTGAEEVTVAVARAEPATITRTVEGVADVRAYESVVVTAEAAGRVAEIVFDQGERVPAGAVLVRLDAAQETADVATRRAEAAELRGRLARLERLVAEGAVPRGDVEDVRRAVQAADARTASSRTILDDTVIRAPFAGTIGLREVSPGALVQPGAELVTLDRIDQVRLRFTLPEATVGRVRVGSGVEARTPAYPRDVFRGRLASFDSRLDPQQRTLAVEALLPNPDGRLRPGMLANVRVEAETIAEAVTIPPVALQVRGGTHFVYRIENGCAIRAEVEIGQREPERVEIVKGLAAGALVATEGLQDLSSGTPVIDKRQAAERAKREKADGGGAKQKDKEKEGGGPPTTDRCNKVTGEGQPSAPDAGSGRG